MTISATRLRLLCHRVLLAHQRKGLLDTLDFLVNGAAFDSAFNNQRNGQRDHPGDLVECNDRRRRERLVAAIGRDVANVNLNEPVLKIAQHPVGLCHRRVPLLRVRKMVTPKSKKSRRVDMSRDLRSALLALRSERMAQAQADGKTDISDDLVFPAGAGTPIEMNNFTERVFKPLLARAGMRRIRFHDLRHTYGSMLIQAGASLAYVRDQMGHSSIQVTVDIYGHLIPGANMSFVDRLDAMALPQQSAIQPQSAIQRLGRCGRCLASC